MTKEEKDLYDEKKQDEKYYKAADVNESKFRMFAMFLIMLLCVGPNVFFGWKAFKMIFDKVSPNFS